MTKPDTTEIITQLFRNFRETVAEALGIDINTDSWMDGDVERETGMILSFIERLSAVVMCPNCGAEFHAQDHPARSREPLPQEDRDIALREHIAVSLRVLFPGEAWTTYVRAAVCLVHEFRREAHHDQR